MPSDKTFIHLFASYYVTAAFIIIVLFIFITLKIMDGVFSYYSDTIHNETRQMLVDKVSMYYSLYHTWDGYDGTETGESAAVSGDYFTLEDNRGEIVYSTEDPETVCCDDERHKYVAVKEIINVGGEFVGIITVGYFSGHITSIGEEALRKNGISKVILAIIVINVLFAAVTLLFFYRLSKPLKPIVDTASDISHGDFCSRIKVDGKIREMNMIAASINSLGDSLLKQESFRRELTSILSHELRTPLHILLSQSEAILDGIYAPDKERMEAMRAEICRIVSLLDELEDRLMYYTENFAVVVERADVSELVKKIAIGYEGVFAKKGLYFKREIENGIFLKLDRSRFSQVLVNILSNSIKYTPSGGVTLTLKKRGDGKAVLSVEDTGEGIDDGYMKYIFNCFYHSGEYPESRGVGLYIVRQIVEKHGWELNVKSEKGKGTLVEVVMD